MIAYALKKYPNAIFNRLNILYLKSQPRAYDKPLKHQTQRSVY